MIVKIGIGVDIGTATNRSNGLLQLPYFLVLLRAALKSSAAIILQDPQST